MPIRVSLAAILAGACAATPAADTDTLLIRDAVVVSPERAAPLSGTDVLIRDGRIVEVGRGVRAPSGAQVLEAEGRYLIPGLIDSHVHLQQIPGMRGDHEAAHPEVSAAAWRQIPRSYLFYGFTTVIDLNADPDFIADWNAAEVRPTARYCAAAPAANGYPMVFMPEEIRFTYSPYFLDLESERANVPADIDLAEHQPRAVIRRIEEETDAICVKVHHEEGFGGLFDWPTPTVAMIRELVSEAHARGLVVALHSNSLSAHRFGLETGVDVFAHGLWHWEELNLAAGVPNAVADALDAVAARGIGYQATIQVVQGEKDMFDPAYLDDPRLADAIPASLLAWYGTEEAGWFRDRLLKNYSENPDKIVEFAGADAVEDHAGPSGAAIDRVSRAVARLDALGANLLLGSDTPSSPAYTNTHGLNGRMEIDRLAEAGVSPARIFQAATLANARAFGLDDEVGSVEAGKRADLLLSTANPLETVAAYDAIDVVILAGRPMVRNELSAHRASEAN